MIVKWLHGAIKQFTNKHKEIGKHLREARLEEETDVQTSELQKAISAKIEELGIKRPAKVVLVDDVETQQVETLRKGGTLVFSKTLLFSTSFAKAGRTGKLKKKKAALLEQKVTGAIQLLDAWGLLQDMPYEEQQRLLKDLIEIFTFNSRDE
jgi:hypothetical protein